MRFKILTSLLAAGSLFMGTAALATDYSSYSLQELSQMRCNMMNMSQEDRDAFRMAWREKMQNASEKERQIYAWGHGNSRNKYGRGDCGGCNKGSGHGHGHGHGHKYWK